MFFRQWLYIARDFAITEGRARGPPAFSCFAHDLFDLGLRWIVRGSHYTGRAHGHEYDHQQDHQQAPEDEKPVPVNHVMQLQSVAPNPARRSRQLLQVNQHRTTTAQPAEVRCRLITAAADRQLVGAEDHQVFETVPLQVHHI